MATNYFWWTNPVKKVTWDPFWWVFAFLVVLFVPFLRVWWWVFLPLFLQAQLRELYLWWVGWDFAYAKTRWAMLELIPSKENLVPLKAMEDVFNIFWPTIWDSGNWREHWFEGMLWDTPGWCSFEIASIEGKLHFYLRCQQGHKTGFETALYAHYPNLEIREVEDYTKLVPPTVPNEEWDVWGEDFVQIKGESLPIKTYEKFFEPQGEKISAEEKRIDPILALLEMMSRLGPGEHYWVQFNMMATDKNYNPEVFADAQKVISKIAKRPEKKEVGFFEELFHVMAQLIAGPAKEGSGEKATYKWLPMTKEESGEREMVLTPGEREILTEVERKMSKPLFRVNIRAVYVAKRESWRSPHRILMRSYGAHFSSENLNGIKFTGKTRPKTQYVFRKRIPFIRARRMFRNYVLRFPPMFPDRKELCPVLNSEEMATLFHFPVKIEGMIAPALSKIESKKAGPPPNLPIE